MFCFPQGWIGSSYFLSVIFLNHVWVLINILCTCGFISSLLSEQEFTMFARAGGIILSSPIFFLSVLIGEDGLSLQLLWGLIPSHSLEVLTITRRSVTHGPLSLT